MIRITVTNKRKKNKKTWLWEFSKKILFILTILYVVERLFSMVMIYVNGFPEMDTFIKTGAEVFIAGVISYGVKAGLENVVKISKKEEEGETDNGMAD